MTELIGWISTLILCATISRQVYAQWRTKSTAGVSRWLFAGQLAASVGFVVYSFLLDNWIFVFSNVFLLFTALLGQVLYTKNRLASDRRADQGTPEDAWHSWPGLQAISTITTAELAQPAKRVVIVAPHPDDEILMVGGLLQQLYAQGSSCLLIAVTDGEASHPGSAEWTPERLQRERPIESLAALHALQIGLVEVKRLAYPDSELANCAGALYDELVGLLRPDDVVFSTWSLDKHRDHEVCGTSVAAAAALLGAKFIEVPVWTWHWAVPADTRVPWSRARRLVLDAAQVARKQASMAVFHSQLGTDPDTGRPAVLPASMLARLSRPYEIFFL